jgi:hypothetical protein
LADGSHDSPAQIAEHSWVPTKNQTLGIQKMNMRFLIMALSLLTSLSGCGLTSSQAVYDEIRAQERAKAVGTSVPPGTGLPRYDQYQKERSQLAPESR